SDVRGERRPAAAERGRRGRRRRHRARIGPRDGGLDSKFLQCRSGSCKPRGEAVRSADRPDPIPPRPPMKAKLLLVAGARPNYMKIAPIYWAVRDDPSLPLTVELLHTGQHYDDSMSGSFFRDLGLPEPGVNLGVGSGSHAAQTAKVMVAFEHVLL